VTLQTEIPSRLDAYRRPRAGILANEFPDDQPLSERGLAERLGLGRMPVREASKDLERDGLVEVQPLRGTFIRRLSFDEMRDLYEVRLGLNSRARPSSSTRSAPGPSPRNRSSRVREVTPKQGLTACGGCRSAGSDGPRRSLICPSAHDD